MNTNSEIKPTFLLSNAVIVPNEPHTGSQSSDKIKREDNPNLASVMSLGTQSKTFAAPSDDDPDWETESCF